MSVAASSAAEASLRCRPTCSASTRAASAARVLGRGQLLAPQLGQFGLQPGKLATGLLVLGVQPQLAGVQAGHLGLERR